MNKQVFYLLVLTLCINASARCQEHGLPILPGKDFPYLPTSKNYNFQDLKLTLVLRDDRARLKLEKVNCSKLEFTNTSEFAEAGAFDTIWNYFHSLFYQSGIIISHAADDTLEVRLEGIDVRLIGFIYIRVHGLCQMTMTYKHHTKTYCTDIKDGDPDAPLSSSQWETRLTATRYMGSAAIRKTIEQFLDDLNTLK